MKSLKIVLFIISSLMLLTRCIEPFEPENIDFEDLLVIEARITNEYKFHNIKLSRTYQIDTLRSNPEKGAKIFITDNQNIVYNFEEIEDGLYQSITEFSVNQNKSYSLKIETNDGNSYYSTEERLPPIIPIDKINYSVEINNLNEEEVSIQVSSYNPNDNAHFYSYEYEETYKIITPFWSPYRLDVSNPADPVIVFKNYDDKVCFKTQYSNSIKQTETKSLIEDKVDNFTIRSISTTDFILSNRYSILIKQYVRTENCYNYFEKLKTFSESENIFTENQIGFFNGNINSLNNKEKVIGFFEISSVSVKRFFLNREDINDKLIPFIDNCSTITPLIYDSYSGTFNVANAINNGYVFFDKVPRTRDSGPYALVPQICGDCRVLGSNVKPDFWVD
ncbi:conserved hypothetical protein [Tenacibaculum sediminilitoris]|uniref:DUF4249 domain-containing protein n=1 Tax=Tenacibaculum sediminilitoris TaxID=1820334 RepID=UPI003895EB7E